MPSSCDFCKTGHIVKRESQITFRQWTDKGYIFCRVVIPIGVCSRCGSRDWDAAAEAIIEKAVRTEYEKVAAQDGWSSCDQYPARPTIRERFPTAGTEKHSRSGPDKYHSR